MATVWIIDSSSVIAAVRHDRVSREDRRVLLEGLTRLVDEGRLLSPPECCDEFERYGGTPNHALDWWMAHRDRCQRKASLVRVADVLTRVPEILDERKDSGADEADPYVLALALDVATDGADVRVITEERRTAVRKMSLASAAGFLGLPAVDLRTMMKFEGILSFDSR